MMLHRCQLRHMICSITHTICSPCSGRISEFHGGPSMAKGKKPSRHTTYSTQSPSPSSAHQWKVPSPCSDKDAKRDLDLLLSRATSIFPNHISESALLGRIVASDTREHSSSKVWLSEAAMVSSSLHPGSLVTVSLAASSNSRQDGLPLDLFVDRLASNLGVEVDVASSGHGKVGSYFAVGTVFASHKVQKNGVRLSYCLSAAMGFPPDGSGVYISPLKNYPACTTKAEKEDDSKLRWFQCNDLQLRLVLINHQKMVASGIEIPVSSTESSPLAWKDGVSTPPRTPMCYKSNFSSGFSPLPASGTKSMGCIAAENDFSFFPLAIEDEKVKEMLQLFACRRLCGRYLLVGNMVSLPICGKLCIFVVEAANSLDLACQMRSDKKKSPDDQVLNLPDEKDEILLVHSKTRVIILDSTCHMEDRSFNRDPWMEFPPRRDVGKNKTVKGFSLGGLDKEIAIIKQVMNLSLMEKESPVRYKGILLHGPPGTGKTSLASTCTRDVGANLFIVNGPEVVSEYYGESEQTLMNVFDSAKKATPAVVFIDELDALSLGMLGTLLTLMDSICEVDGVLVIAATNMPDNIDPALRRHGRFDKEIEIGVPSPYQRLEILTALLDRMHHSINEKEMQSLAMSTHGFVGADLAALCKEAGRIALRRSLEHQNEDPCLAAELPVHMASSVVQKADSFSVIDQVDSISHSLTQLTVSKDCSQCQGAPLCGNGSLLEMTDQVHDSKKELMCKITAEDLKNAKLNIRPSAMREVMLEFPKVRWEDVGGQAEVKMQLIEAVQLPQRCPDAFESIGIRPPRGLLMFGPPGCSKTLLARAVASEAKLNFLAVKGPELFSKWVGDSEKAVKSLFAKARANSPSIIFFDEIDGLAATRGQDQDEISVGDRVLSQLLVEIDGLYRSSGVTVIAATNRPDKIDPALLRPGRFDRHLDVKPPNELDREAIFRVHMKNSPCGSDVTAKDLASLTRGYTGADIKLICREAAIVALEESFEAEEILFKHFQEAIRRIGPTDVDFYLKVSKKFKRYVDSSSTADS